MPDRVAMSNVPRSKAALFRFQPRFKLRSEGDVVVVDDPVILTSFKQSLVVHVSPTPVLLTGPTPKQLLEVSASQVSVPLLPC